jgi:prefoldin subunit 5
MVPMGKKAFVRGTLQHTNEITVSHGASYFSDVSTAQAIDILEHRINNCDERLQAIYQERDLFT